MAWQEGRLDADLPSCFLWSDLKARLCFTCICEAAETSITEEYTEWLNEKWFCFLFQLFSVNRFLYSMPVNGLRGFENPSAAPRPASGCLASILQR